MKVKELMSELSKFNPEFEVCQRTWLGDITFNDISKLYCDEVVETIYLISTLDNYGIPSEKLKGE